MSLISDAIHVAAQPVGWGAEAIGGAQDLIGGGSSSSSLTKLGSNITNPNVHLSNPSGILANNDPAFSGAGAYQPGYNPTSQAASGGGGNNVVNGSQPNTGVNSGVYSGSGSAAAANAANIAAYQDQMNALNQLLSNANINYNNGQNQINTGYNNAFAQLQGNNNNVLQGYNNQKTQTSQDYNKALNTINANARNGYNSLEALLGGTGSAGDILAPFAVSNAANQQRGSSSDAFAQNLQNIQQGVDAANLNFRNQSNTLLGQKNTQLQNLLDNINQQKIQYQQQLAADQNQMNVLKGGSYQTPTAINDNISQLLAQQQDAAKQYAQPQFTVQDYTAPQTNLAAYQAQAAKLAGNGSQDTTANDPTVALTNLLKNTQSTNQYAY